MTDKQTVKFGEIFREVKLSTKDPIADGYERYIGLEHLDSGFLKIKRWGMIAEDNPSFTRVFKKGHVLFGKRRPYLKKAAIAEFDGICSSDIIVLNPEPGLIKSNLLPYLFYSSKLWDRAISTSSGSLSPRTKYKDLKDLEFRVLSGHEQERIETNIRNISNAESINEAALRSCNTSLELLTKELLSNEKKFSKMKFEDVFEIRSGKGFKKSEYSSEGAKLLRIDNVSWDATDWQNTAYLPISYMDAHPDLVLKANDIVVALNRPITQGKLKISRIKDSDLPAILYQRVGLISSKLEYLTPDLVFYLLRLHLYTYVIESSVGSDQPFINLTGLRNSYLLVPKKEIVKEIENTLNSMFSIRQFLLESLVAKREMVESIVVRNF